MKLELKHLAPYLPYELKVTRNLKKIDTLGIFIGLEFGKNVYDVSYVLCNDLKPILRPLSEIESYFEPLAFNDSKILEVLDVNYLDDFGNMSIQDIEHYSFTNYPVSVYNLLLEHHFDVFGLIHNNMAISVHDVEQVIA